MIVIEMISTEYGAYRRRKAIQCGLIIKLRISSDYYQRTSMFFHLKFV